MTPVQIAVLWFTMITIVVAWLRGGPPEQLCAVAILIWVTASVGTPNWLDSAVVGRIPVVEAARELALLVFLIWMAMTGDRWWLFAASAVMTLSLFIYLAVALVPEMDRRAEISAHLGLIIVLDLSLLAGVAERWLAGEHPTPIGARWNRRATGA